MSEIRRSRYVRDDEHNPYAAPEADFSPEAEGRELVDEAEQIRREYQKHEINVKSIGLLYYLSAAFCVLMAVAFVLGGSRMANRENPIGPGGVSQFLVGLGIFVGLIGGLNIAIGIGLRRLRSWSRWGAVIQTSLGLLMLGIRSLSLLASGHSPDELVGQLLAILLSVYVLSLLLSPKSPMIFSAEYQDVIAQTPHIRTGTSVLVKVLLGFVGILLLFAFIGGLLAALQGNR